MNTPKYEIPTEMRDLAEKSVDQARKAFDGFLGAAQKAVGQADSTATTMQSSARAIGDKAVAFTEQNVRSAFDYAQKVVRVSDMQELMALQSEYVKTQLTAMQEQAKEIGSAVQSSVGTTFSKS